jgi:hypothetical protein
MTEFYQRTTLTPRNLAGEEDVWYVQAAWPDGRSEQIGAFRTRSETQEWIAQKSKVWLDNYERRTKIGLWWQKTITPSCAAP